MDHLWLPAAPVERHHRRNAKLGALPLLAGPLSGRWLLVTIRMGISYLDAGQGQEWLSALAAINTWAAFLSFRSCCDV